MPFIGGVGIPEMLIVGIIALLLFGQRLPEVARSLGKGMMEFKKGISGIESDLENATYASSETPSSRPIPEEEYEREELTAPKFEPPKFDISEQETSDTTT